MLRILLPLAGVLTLIEGLWHQVWWYFAVWLVVLWLAAREWNKRRKYARRWQGIARIMDREWKRGR